MGADGRTADGITGTWVEVGVAGKPDIILENSTGSTPDGTGIPAAAAAAIISAGVGSKVPVTTLWYTGSGAGAEVGDVSPRAGLA